MRARIRATLATAVLTAAIGVAAPSGEQPHERRTGITGPLSVAAVGDALTSLRFSTWDDRRFLEVIRLIRNSDAAFANVEMLFHEFEGAPSAVSGGTWLGADPAVADDLKWAGFDLFGLANNHTGDYGEYGLRRTLEVLSHLGVTHAGVGRTLGEARRPAYFESAKGRVALVSCASTFTAHSRAGHPRPDVPGRPGLSALRHQRTYRIDGNRFADLKRVAEALAVAEPTPDADGVFTLFGTRFKVGETSGIDWTAHPGDQREILDAVREARRQADFVILAMHAHEPGNASPVPAPFVMTFARAAIEAGADMFIGSGPHRLRGIEIHKGRPIFYSLGDFFFQNDAIDRLPSDFFEQYNLPWHATVADAFDARDNSPRAFAHTRANFESVIAISHFAGQALESIRLYPITLGYDEPRSRRGRPMIASAEDGQRILAELVTLSKPFGTVMELRDGVAIVTAAKQASAGAPP